MLKPYAGSGSGSDDGYIGKWFGWCWWMGDYWIGSDHWKDSGCIDNSDSENDGNGLMVNDDGVAGDYDSVSCGDFDDNDDDGLMVIGLITCGD